jgi:hypothetical protein
MASIAIATALLIGRQVRFIGSPFVRCVTADYDEAYMTAV